MAVNGLRISWPLLGELGVRRTSDDPRRLGTRGINEGNSAVGKGVRSLRTVVLAGGLYPAVLVNGGSYAVLG